MRPRIANQSGAGREGSPEGPRTKIAVAPEVQQTLSEVFGFAALRPGQADVIADVLAKKPVVSVMPTGAGKSLCYQLPAVVLSRRAEKGATALVVSPLIALMKDQVDALRARGIASAALTSAANPQEQAEILTAIGAGQYRLVYIAPERFRSPRFLAALGEIKNRISLLAIDEAHCISEWGHDFRPDYRRLGDIAKNLAPPRLIALTATATPEVRRDIATQLAMEDPAFHVRGFDRENLRYVVEHTGGIDRKAARLTDLARERPHGPVLIYAITRKRAERYASALADANLRVRAYHAGKGAADRRKIQDAFMAGKLDAIVATNAFGMGIDKPDIRLVIHADVPGSLEAYYQEAGRGGRDGEPADCVLLANPSDARIHRLFIDAANPPPAMLRALWKVAHPDPVSADPDILKRKLPGDPHPMQIKAATRILERHGFLSEQGDDIVATRPADHGDSFPTLDPRAFARRAAIEHQKLRRMLDYVYHPRCRRQLLLDYFGDRDWRDRARQCNRCDGCENPTAAKKKTKTKPRSSDQASTNPADAALVSRLQALRTRLASARAVPAYVVFSNRTLDELARARPATHAELLRVNGIGKMKLEAYGDDILAAVRNAPA